MLKDKRNYLSPEEIKDLKSKTHKSLHRFIDDYEKTGHHDTRNKLKELSESARSHISKGEWSSSKVDSDSWKAPKEVQQAALKDQYIDQREEEYRKHLAELDRKDTERLNVERERQRKNAQIPQTRPKGVVTQEQTPSPDSSEKVTTQPQPRPKQHPKKGRGKNGRGRDNRQPQPSNPIPEQSTPQKQEIKIHKRDNVRRGQNPNKVQPQDQVQQPQTQPVPTQEAEPQTTTSTSQGFFGGLRNKWSGLSTGQKIGVGALGLVGTGLAGYGIKKWRDKRRKKRELEEKERINRAVLEQLKNSRR